MGSQSLNCARCDANDTITIKILVKTRFQGFKLVAASR